MLAWLLRWWDAGSAIAQASYRARPGTVPTYRSPGGPMTDPLLYYLDGNAITARRCVQVFDPDAGKFVPATGSDALSAPQFFLAATKGGSAIDPGLEVTAAEEGTGDGWYYGQFGSAALAVLAAYADQDVWECLYSPSGFKEYRRVRVRATREAGR